MNSYDEFLNHVEYSLKRSNITLGEIMNVVEKQQKVYNINDANKGQLTRELWSIVADRLGMKLMDHLPKEGSAKYGGIFEYNYTESENESENPVPSHIYFGIVLDQQILIVNETNESVVIIPDQDNSWRTVIRMIGDSTGVDVQGRIYGETYECFEDTFLSKKGIYQGYKPNILLPQSIDYTRVIIPEKYDVNIIYCHAIKEIDSHKIPVAVFCTVENSAFSIMWKLEKDNYWEHRCFSILDFLLILDNEVRDIKTGKRLCHILDERRIGKRTIAGVSRKNDGTGYFIWLDPKTSKYSVLWQVYSQLGSTVKSLPFPCESPFSFPWYNIHAAFIRRSWALTRYFSFGFKSSDTPFEVFSRYSLFPYYYRLCTSRSILVIVFDSDEPEAIYVIGYSQKNHRVFKRYSVTWKHNGIYEIEEAVLDRIYNDFDKYLFLLKSQIQGEVILDWIFKFLMSDDYYRATREVKIEMILQMII